MAPELESYKGCDILDINPGVGLWSTKLHERLKPRTHVLVETLKTPYKPFLDELVNQPNSRYRFLKLDVNKFRDLNSESIFCEEGLPPGEHLASVDHQVNRKLLVTGNFSQYPARATFMGLHTLNRLIALSHAGVRISAYGAPKMLMWVASEYSNHFVPRAIRNRNNLNLSTDKHGDINLVCCGTNAGAYSAVSRQRQLEEEVAEKVKERMAAAGIRIPRSCKTESLPDDFVIPRRLIDAELLTGSEGNKAHRVKDWDGPDVYMSELGPIDFNWPMCNNMIEKFVKAEQLYKEAQKPKSKVSTEELRRRKLAVSSLRKDTRYVLRARINIGRMVLATEALRDYKTELQKREIDWDDADFDETHPEEYRRMKELSDAVAHLYKRIDTLKHFIEVEALVDDRFTARRPTPVLAWDRRPYEPLVTNPEDFFPQHALALVNFTPKEMSKEMYERETSRVWWRVVSTLFGSARRNIRTALESITPGASDYILPLVPELTDPAQGGMADPKDFPVRCLSTEQIEHIVQEWEDSPIREEGADTLINDTFEDKFATKAKKKASKRFST